MPEYNRVRKIPLGQILYHLSYDLNGMCLHCKRHRLIKQKEVLALNPPPDMRLDEFEARFKCAHCGKHAIVFQLANANAPFSKTQEQ